MTRRELFQGVIAGVVAVWAKRSPPLRFKGIPIPFDDVDHWTSTWKSCPSPQVPVGIQTTEGVVYRLGTHGWEREV